MPKLEVLGMNARNLRYLRPYNSLRAVRLADNKLVTKKLLIRHGIPTPRLYGAIKDIRGFEKFNWNRMPRNFVIKPARGHGGGGIIILRSTLKRKEFVKIPLREKKWEDSSGRIWKIKNLKWHILNIIEGQFSLANIPDCAIIERRLTRHPVFRKYCKRGIPDIRIIVFNRVPVMAMLRLPTLLSLGKANLALGAVGVGIDVSTGIATYAMLRVPRRRVIERHPNTNQELRGLEIPFWDKILSIAQEAQEVSRLGFLGVDIGIDRKYGPEILEFNARPGLDIQVANLEGLATRLERVYGLKIETKAKGVRLAKELFGGNVERKVEEVSGKEVVGVVEPVLVLNKKGTRKREIKVRIDTGARFTAIDLDLAKRLGYREAIKHYQSFKIKEWLTKEEIQELSRKKIWKKLEQHPDIVGIAKVYSVHGASYRIEIPLVFFIEGRKVISKVTIISRKELEYPMIIGRRDLKGFLVDPAKRKHRYGKY